MPKYDKSVVMWYLMLSEEKQLDPCMIDVGQLIADE
jgi:hypothetical protein